MSRYTAHPDINKVDFHTALGQAIRARREAAGMTQAAVARAIGSSQSTVEKWENGYSPAPSFAVWRLAHLFDCSCDALMVDPAREVAA